MKSGIYIVIVLTFISSFAGGILSWWDHFTSPIIAANREKEFNQALKEVLPAYDQVKEIGNSTGGRYFAAYSKGEIIAYAVLTKGNGFQSVISVLYSLSADKKSIIHMKILEQMETPGLGTKVALDRSNKDNPLWFSSQFSQLVVENGVELIKSKKPDKENQIQAVTGATISSRAIVNQINSSVEGAVWKVK